jgi:ribose 5-phosphate isomerase B
MKIAVGSDERTHLTDAVLDYLAGRQHEVVLFGALQGSQADWPDVAAQVAHAVASGACPEGILFCWTGTGASIAANKVAGIRAALCHDAETARGARIYNHANVLVLSLRATAEAIAAEILEAWFGTPYSSDEWNVRQVARVADLEKGMWKQTQENPAEGSLPVAVYVAANRLEAEVIRGLLNTEGIPASLQYESVGVVYGLTVDGIGETRVLVPSRLEARARAVIAQQAADQEAAAGG